MGNEGDLKLFATFVALGVVCFSLYFLLFGNLPNDATAGRASSGDRTNNPNNRGTNRTGAVDRMGTNAAAGAPRGDSSSINKILTKCATFPIHIGSQSSSRSSGSSLLVEGLLAFRHSRAAGYEQINAAGEVVAKIRKERARTLSRVLALEDSSSDSGGPPVRGSTIVASVPLTEISCSKLRRVLYLFSTYYNLLVILVVPSGTSSIDLDKATMRLRGKCDDRVMLDPEYLPDHRIVAASTTTGRIAFVRQLGKVELVLEFDSEVEVQLTRFGYRVINYKTHRSDKVVSQLGSQLVS